MRAHLGNHRGLVMLLLFSYSLRRSTCSLLSHTVLLLTGNILKVSWTNIKSLLSASRSSHVWSKVSWKDPKSTRLLCLQEILLYAGQGPLYVQKSYTSFTWYDPKYRYGEKRVIQQSHCLYLISKFCSQYASNCCFIRWYCLSLSLLSSARGRIESFQNKRFVPLSKFDNLI